MTGLIDLKKTIHSRYLFALMTILIVLIPLPEKCYGQDFFPFSEPESVDVSSDALCEIRNRIEF